MLRGDKLVDSVYNSWIFRTCLPRCMCFLLLIHYV